MASDALAVAGVDFSAADIAKTGVSTNLLDVLRKTAAAVRRQLQYRQ